MKHVITVSHSRAEILKVALFKILKSKILPLFAFKFIQTCFQTRLINITNEKIKEIIWFYTKSSKNRYKKDFQKHILNRNFVSFSKNIKLKDRKNLP